MHYVAAVSRVTLLFQLCNCLWCHLL